MKIICKAAETIKTAQLAGKEDYEVSLKPDVQIPSSLSSEPGTYVDVTDAGRVDLHFKIGVEARSWGIKGISLGLLPVETSFNILVVSSKIGPDGREIENEFQKTLTFDPSKIELQSRPGSEITITGINIKLNDQLEIDPSGSYIEATTLMGAIE